MVQKKLENVQSMKEMDEYFEYSPNQLGKSLVKQIIKRALSINATFLMQMMSQRMGELTFLAFYDGKSGKTDVELKKEYGEWLKTHILKPDGQVLDKK